MRQWQRLFDGFLQEGSRLPPSRDAFLLDVAERLPEAARAVARPAVTLEEARAGGSILRRRRRRLWLVANQPGGRPGWHAASAGMQRLAQAVRCGPCLFSRYSSGATSFTKVSFNAVNAASPKQVGRQRQCHPARSRVHEQRRAVAAGNAGDRLSRASPRSRACIPCSPSRTRAARQSNWLMEHIRWATCRRCSARWRHARGCEGSKRG